MGCNQHFKTETSEYSLHNMVSTVVWTFVSLCVYSHLCIPLDVIKKCKSNQSNISLPIILYFQSIYFYSFHNYIAMPVLNLSFSMALHYSGCYLGSFEEKQSLLWSHPYIYSLADTPPQDIACILAVPVTYSFPKVPVSLCFWKAYSLCLECNLFIYLYN